MTYYNKHIFICVNQKGTGKTCCANTGGEEYFHYIKAKLLARDLLGEGKIRVSQSGCLGRCSLGPCIVIYPEGIWYSYKSFADIDKIIESHLISSIIVRDLLVDNE